MWSTWFTRTLQSKFIVKCPTCAWAWNKEWPMQCLIHLTHNPVIFIILDSIFLLPFTLTWSGIQLNALLVGIIMCVHHGIMWSESNHFLIYHYPIQNGCEKILKHVYWKVIENAHMPKGRPVKVSVIIADKACSSVDTTRNARKNHFCILLYTLLIKHILIIIVKFLFPDLSIQKVHWNVLNTQWKASMPLSVFSKISILHCPSLRNMFRDFLAVLQISIIVGLLSL